MGVNYEFRKFLTLKACQRFIDCFSLDYLIIKKEIAVINLRSNEVIFLVCLEYSI